MSGRGCDGKKKTLHDYLYENLKEQIQTGYYKYGEALPSMNQLCETYHVGIRTVRDVLSDLRDQGMIRTEERRPAVIVYRKQGKGTLFQIYWQCFRERIRFWRYIRQWSS